ncbi:MAG: hypothetical protein LC114_04380 [Bryobacterales bacterium]|nr:hypothetical protein [Bryobacterales bacterium]
MITRRFLWIGALAIAGFTFAQGAAIQKPQSRLHRVEHSLAGELKKVDKDTKTIVVKTADGTEEAVKYTDRTVVRSLDATGRATEKAGRATALAGKEGSQVVVHYTEEGAVKTASGVDRFGRDSVHVSKGVITGVDRTAGTVTVKTEHGAEETYHVAKDASVDTEHGVVRFSDAAGKDAKEGAHVTVHYTEDAGRKVGHLVKVAGKAL